VMDTLGAVVSFVCPNATSPKERLAKIRRDKKVIGFEKDV